MFIRLRKLEIFFYLRPSLFSKLKILLVLFFMYNNQFCEVKYEKLSFKHQREWKLIENMKDLRSMEKPFRNFPDFYKNRNLT